MHIYTCIYTCIHTHRVTGSRDPSLKTLLSPSAGKLLPWPGCCSWARHGVLGGLQTSVRRNLRPWANTMPASVEMKLLRIRTYVPMRVCMTVYVRMHVYLRVGMYVYIYRHLNGSLDESVYGTCRNACMYVRMYVCSVAYIYIYTRCIYIYDYIYTHALVFLIFLYVHLDLNSVVSVHLCICTY